MRKLFSLIAAVLFAGSMMAAEVTITPANCGWSSEAGEQSGVVEGVTVAVGNGLASETELRVYKNQVLTISADVNITKIVFTCTANGTAKYGPGCFAAQDGYTFEAEGPTGTWEGEAKSITFTAESNQVRATSIVVTLDGEEEDPDEIVIYDWANKTGITIFGGNSNITTGTVKIHKNVDEMPAIVFASSYVYADGKYIAIKPAEGGFKAGDVLYVAAVFSDNNDSTKYAQVDLRAADGDTRIWLSDSASTIDVKTSAADPIVQTYKLESDQDSLLLGRYGNTKMYILTIMVGRPEVEPQPVMDYYVVGTMTEWKANANYKLAANPAAEGEFMGEFAFKANDGFKVAYSDGATIANDAWFPDGMENEYKITEDGDYAVYFRPDGQGGEGWHYGFIYVAKKEVPVVDTITCAKAAEDALAGETYETYVKGYVTEIAYAWKNGSMSFWMADEKDGGKVFEAYKCAIEKEEDAVRVGDLVKAHGTLTKYNTTPELAEGCTVEILERAPEVVPQNLGEKTIAEFLELKNRVDTCILTGTVKNIVMDSQDPTLPNIYGNFDLEDATASVYVYGLLTPEGEAKKFREMDIVEGDVIIIKALYTEYNNNPQVKNAILVRKKGQGLDNTDAEVKVEKFFRNGQLIIRKNGVEYNAQGAIVR